MSKSDKTVSLFEMAGMFAGLLFVFSSITKAIDSALFAQTIGSYGFPGLQFLAPVIIIAEVLLGMFLVFGVHLKWSAFAGGIMVICFTLFYTYALVFRGITDCGCFGKFTALNSSPVFLYVKNLILLALMTYVFIKADAGLPRYQWIYAIIIVVVAVIGFCSGNTWFSSGAGGMKKTPRPMAVKKSPLADFVTVSPDSTYVVFVFSYTCPHCMNSIANINEYEHFGIADKVIGLALGNEEAETEFLKATEPRFPIHNHSQEIFKLSSNFPVTYYIQNDSIRFAVGGELPAAALFKNIL